MDSTIRYGRIIQGSSPCRGTKINTGVWLNWIRHFGSNEKIEGSNPSTPINL